MGRSEPNWVDQSAQFKRGKIGKCPLQFTSDAEAICRMVNCLDHFHTDGSWDAKGNKFDKMCYALIITWPID